MRRRSTRLGRPGSVEITSRVPNGVGGQLDRWPYMLQCAHKISGDAIYVVVEKFGANRFFFGGGMGVRELVKRD